MNRIIGIIGVGVIAAITATTTMNAQGTARPDRSDLPLVVTLSAVVTVQVDDTTNNNGKTGVLTSQTTQLKFTTADIINTVEGANFATPTKNAKLVVSTAGVQVLDGTNTYDASDFVTITFDPEENGVWVGTDSTSNTTLDETVKYTGHYLVGFDFDRGNGDVISVGGLATETYSLGKKSKSGAKPISDSVSVTFVGTGVKTGAHATVAGSLKASTKTNLLP
jgi:hypothetical protein